MNPNKILDRAYQKAVAEYKKNDLLFSLKVEQRNRLKIVIDKVEQQKAIVTVIITSLVKKIDKPSQDIRLHQSKMDGGYSGRGLDTKYVTPFLKLKFPRYAMKESGWLTRSLEQKHPYTLDYPGAIGGKRNQEVKTAFLNILNDVEKNHTEPEKYLIAILTLLIRKKTRDEDNLLGIIESGLPYHSSITIERIINKLKQHFQTPRSSRLPVIAIYSIYQLMMSDVKRYSGKDLLQLRSHTSSDRYAGYGDIEIGNDTTFEVVEIKHNIAIDKQMVADVFSKIKNTMVNRYYILTTAKPYIVPEQQEEINVLIMTIKKRHGCEIVVNGIIPSIKYYLRLLREPSLFLEKYTQNLEEDFKRSTEVKVEHLSSWNEIMSSLGF